ncbi:Aminotransferase class-V domain containing protein [Klebsormidium nitens]|uniref:Aminotransferase class-V domain containing protein n=1 Tax=Klebsormidium nitens TaxID=105231 RepID=A0A0U9HKR0_KLENI|nr:Aminotransferase class-V domain containing protein [Klebsormidium nitens]|eukprot:GAQ81234.1 Aminotransferase class-V domain containing protein [Klebsormidium nitens]
MGMSIETKGNAVITEKKMASKKPSAAWAFWMSSFVAPPGSSSGGCVLPGRFPQHGSTLYRSESLTTAALQYATQQQAGKMPKETAAGGHEEDPNPSGQEYRELSGGVRGQADIISSTSPVVVSPASLQGEALFGWLRQQVVGITAEIVTPFGTRQMTYTDYIASGRCLQYVEDLLQARVLPFYGNTHTEDSACGQRTTHFAHEAGEYIKECVQAGPEHKILFCGSGCTAAVKRLQEIMGIAVPSTLRARVLATLQPSERWVVFVGPYEHHSNLLTWRQSLADVVEVPLSEDGLLDMAYLEKELENERWSGRPKLGSFSAASNVTGILTDTRALARLLHAHGAYACFDFAAAAPYVDMDMRPGQADGYDALLISPHKFVGGPGSSGVLIVSEKLYALADAAPSTSGGGTVTYVNGNSEAETLYISDIEQREDAGTPAILQKMRAALAFWVKQCIGADVIERTEGALIRAALQRLARNPRVEVLGNCEVPRLAVLSFLIRPFSTSTTGRNGKALNGRFVVNLLNDLFGIQARGGCSCAGPYGHALMNVDRQLSVAIREAIADGNESVKPGWTRLGFAYFITQAEFEFILAAIEFVAEYGVRFLPLYDFDWKSGNWSYKGFQRESQSLFDPVTVDEAACLWKARGDALSARAEERAQPPYARYLKEAQALAVNLPPYKGAEQPNTSTLDERVITFVV